MIIGMFMSLPGEGKKEPPKKYHEICERFKSPKNIENKVFN